MSGVLEFLTGMGRMTWDALNNFIVPGIGCSALGLMLGGLLIIFFAKFLGLLFGNVFGGSKNDK